MSQGNTVLMGELAGALSQPIIKHKVKKPPLPKKVKLVDVARKKTKLLVYRYKDYLKTMLIALM